MRRGELWISPLLNPRGRRRRSRWQSNGRAGSGCSGAPRGLS
jgi:hypothetical protein